MVTGQWWLPKTLHVWTWNWQVSLKNSLNWKSKPNNNYGSGAGGLSRRCALRHIISRLDLVWGTFTSTVKPACCVLRLEQGTLTCSSQPSSLAQSLVKRDHVETGTSGCTGKCPHPVYLLPTYWYAWVKQLYSKLCLWFLLCRFWFFSRLDLSNLSKFTMYAGSLFQSLIIVLALKEYF